MIKSVKYKIKVDGLVVVKGDGMVDAMHYLEQYRDDGKKVVLTIEVHNQEGATDARKDVLI